MSKYKISDVFIGNYPVSQYFGERPDYYKQFGLAGHEGVDYATPVGVQIIAPFNGEILRDVDLPGDKDYGDFIVVWDPVQHCAVWYCHLSENRVSFGQKVTKGQVLGTTGNTGNSSGPHLHLGFTEGDANKNRLDKGNGYQGFKNILDPNLVQWALGGNPSPAPVPPTVNMITDQTKIPQIDNMEVQAIRSTLSDQKNQIASLTGQINDLKVQLANQPTGVNLTPEELQSLKRFLKWVQLAP